MKNLNLTLILTIALAYPSIQAMEEASLVVAAPQQDASKAVKVNYSGLPQSPTTNTLGSKYLEEYVTHLHSQEARSEKESQFLDLVQTDTWTWTSLFDCLIGSENAPRMLENNFPLLKVASVLLFLSDKPQDVKVMWLTLQMAPHIIDRKFKELDTLFGDLGFKSFDGKVQFNSVFSTCLPQEASLGATPLSYASLTQAILQNKSTQNYEFEELLAMEVDQFLELVARLKLTQYELAIIDQVSKGNIEAVTNYIADSLSGKRQTKDVLTDLLTLVALKAGHFEIVQDICNSQVVDFRAHTSADQVVPLLVLIMLQAAKDADTGLCATLGEYFLRSFYNREFPFTQSVVLAWLIPTCLGNAKTPAAIERLTAILDGGLKACNVAQASHAAPFFKACLVDDANAALKEFEMLRNDPSDDGNVILQFTLKFSFPIIFQRGALKVLAALVGNKGAGELLAREKAALIQVAQAAKRNDFVEILQKLKSESSETLKNSAVEEVSQEKAIDKHPLYQQLEKAIESGNLTIILAEHATFDRKYKAITPTFVLAHKNQLYGIVSKVTQNAQLQAYATPHALGEDVRFAHGCLMLLDILKEERTTDVFRDAAAVLAIQTSDLHKAATDPLTESLLLSRLTWLQFINK